MIVSPEATLLALFCSSPVFLPLLGEGKYDLFCIALGSKFPFLSLAGPAR